VFFAECRSWAVLVRASPHAFGPQQPHRLPETGDVMEPDMAAPVANSHDAAVTATREVITGFNAQKQARPGCRDNADVDALDTEQRIRARAPAPTGTRHRVIHVRVSFGIGLLGRYQFKEALTSFPPHHAATKTSNAAAAFSDRQPHDRWSPQKPIFTANPTQTRL
jgi:hypothetical protein